MKRIGVLLAAVAVTAVAIGTETDSCVANVVLSQDADTGRVSVAYDLTTDRIVTAEILTNGVAVGSMNQRQLSGDVNRLVAGGTGRSLVWIPPPLFAASTDSFAAGAVSVRLTAWTPGTPPDYTVFDLIDGSRTYYVDEASLPLGIESDVYRTTKLVMRKIPAADVVWQIGSPAEENGRNANETRHEVLLTNDYYMSVFEFTQGQLEAVSGSRTVGGYTPYFGGTRYAVRPVENMRFHVFNGTFMPTFRTRLGLDTNLRMPTAAEWEYACRAGTGTALPSGKDTATVSKTEDPNLTEISRCSFNACPDGQTPAADCDPDAGGTARVGSYPANAWGLYDMIGNVMEMCCDMFTTYPTTREVAPNEPLAEDTSSYNVRGGAWTSNGTQARSAARCGYNKYVSANHIGYRVSLQIHAPACSAGTVSGSDLGAAYDPLNPTACGFWDVSARPLAYADAAAGESTQSYVLRRSGCGDSTAVDIDNRCLTRCVSDAITFLSTKVRGLLMLFR